MGSKDRKAISHLCYCCCRTGKALPDSSIEDKIKAGLFLCSSTPNDLLQTLHPEWHEKVQLSLIEKFALLQPPINSQAVFPWQEELSAGIDYENYVASFFDQPDLFLRIRPLQRETVLSKLTAAGIAFTLVNDDCIAITNAVKVDTVLEINKEVVVQDFSSQRVGEFLKLFQQHKKLKVWDCCAASGGKSILAKDTLGEIELTVSDVRESSIHNLRKRLAAAGMNAVKSFVADLSNPSSVAAMNPVDVIIADVPCSGSGTWSRTPEQLYFFKKEKIREYAALQQKILATIVPKLKPGGYLLYSTCSVFADENENCISKAKTTYGLTEIKHALLTGYTRKADTMFACLLQNPL